MADYTNVTVKDDHNQTVLSGATADRDGEGTLRVNSTQSPTPTLEVGATYSIDGDPDLHVQGELEAQDGHGMWKFKVDFGR